MRKFSLILLTVSLVACSSSSDNTEVSDVTSTTQSEVSTTISTDTSDTTTTTEAVISYKFDVEKMYLLQVKNYLQKLG